MMEFVDPEAQQRIERRGISLEAILQCVEQPSTTYVHRDYRVYVAPFDERRMLKVAMRDGLIANAFTHL